LASALDIAVIGKNEYFASAAPTRAPHGWLIFAQDVPDDVNKPTSIIGRLPPLSPLKGGPQ